MSSETKKLKQFNVLLDVGTKLMLNGRFREAADNKLMEALQVAPSVWTKNRYELSLCRGPLHDKE